MLRILPTAVLTTLLLAPLAMGHGFPLMGWINPFFETGNWDTHDYGFPATGAAVGPRVDGFPLGDGHQEFAVGGAWLLVVTPTTVPCLGAVGHHPEFPLVTVDDVALGAGATFTVAIDLDGCGNFEEDVSLDCIGNCVVPFPPGNDGAYRVYVTGTKGHVIA